MALTVRQVARWPLVGAAWCRAYGVWAREQTVWAGVAGSEAGRAQPHVQLGMIDDPVGSAAGGPDLEALKRQLESTGDYRVLRRLQQVSEFSPANELPKHVAVYLDTETTGLEVGRDKVIELAMVAFEYDLQGNVYRVLRTSSQLEDPGRPLPAEIVSLTGLTDEDLAGQSISDTEVAEFLDQVRLVIAHNAGFDRPFVERRLPQFANLPWACSISDVGWRDLGFSSSSMDYLAYKHGFFFDGHRALVDSLAGVQILASSENGTGRTALGLLRENALLNSVRLWAENSPFESKDVLRERRYRWNPEARAWWTEVPEEQHEAELEWLAANVYKRQVELPFFRVTARERYSLRVPTTILADSERR